MKPRKTLMNTVTNKQKQAVCIRVNLWFKSVFRFRYLDFFVFFFALCSLLFASPAHAAGDLDATLWNRRCPIVLQSSEVSGTGNLTNFPVLLTEDCFPSEMFDADGASPALDGGADLRFSSDINGATELCFEVVDCSTDNDPANGTAEVWVKIPTLDYDDDTTIYVWYNNASASAYAIDDTYGAENVWDSDYVMVQHLEESDIDGGANDITDSTTNDNDGTTSGMDGNDDVSAKIGNGFDFDGNNDYVKRTVSNFNSSAQQGTLSAWIKTSTQGQYIFSSSDEASTSRYFGFNVTTLGGGTIFIQQRNNEADQSWVRGDTLINDGLWHYVAVTSNGSSWSLYVDGAVESLTLGGDGNNNGDWFADTSNRDHILIGVLQRTSLESYFTGTIDEVKISNTANSGPWIATEYANQNAPATFAVEGTPSDPSPSLDSSLWGRKCAIVIQSSEVSGSGNLANFPALLTEDTLPSEMFGGGNAAKDGGGDIRFSSDSDGTTELCFEIVDFDTTADEAEVWVKIPSLSGTSDTTFYVWYDYTNANAYAIDDTYGAENVWDANYLMVQHMNDTTMSTITDSTSNDMDGTKKAAVEPSQSAISKIGVAQDFAGDDDYINFSNISSSGDITFEAWIYPDDYDVAPTHNQRIVMNYDGSNDLQIILREADSFVWGTNTGDVGVGIATEPTLSMYTFIAGVRSGGAYTVYYNGVAQSSSAQTPGDPSPISQVLRLGADINEAGSNGHFDGEMDEVKISNAARSADWIQTEYNNQNGPGSFAVEGTPDDGDAGSGSDVPPFTFRGNEGLSIRGGTMTIRS